MRWRWIVSLAALVGFVAYLAVPARAPEPSAVDAPRRFDGKETVVFQTEGDPRTPPRVVSDLTGWGERPGGGFDGSIGQMTRIGTTNVFRLTAAAEPGSRIEYLFVHGAGDYRLDPGNPRKAARVGGDASELVTAGYVPPAVFADPPPAQAGRLAEVSIKSRALGGERRTFVYTPYGYSPASKYPVAIFHDGALVVRNGEAARQLDWLIARGRMPPIVAAFVDPMSRTEDYRRGSPMRDFVSTELMDWLRERYAISPLEADHALIGISASARGVVDAVATVRGVFGGIGLMLPAVEEADVSAVPARHVADAPLRAVILSARYDTLYRQSAHLAADALKRSGHDVTLIEVNEGHSTVTWTNHFADVLEALFRGR